MAFGMVRIVFFDHHGWSDVKRRLKMMLALNHFFFVVIFFFMRDINTNSTANADSKGETHLFRSYTLGVWPPPSNSDLFG